jgi:hypothetical protein
MIHTKELRAEDVRAYTVDHIMRHIKLETEGYRCSTEMMWNVLVKAAIERTSIQASCADLSEVVDSNTMREQINARLGVNQLAKLEVELNEALAACWPTDVPRQGMDVAIDTHDEPFYGKTPALLAYTCRGQANKGTSHFVRIASAYLMWRQVRLTLAVTFVRPDDKPLDIVRRLYEGMRERGFVPSVVYLDKLFGLPAIVRYLTQQRQPAILACTIRGQKGGTRALAHGRKSYRTPHTFKDGTHVEMAMVATFTLDHTGKRRRKWQAFILVLLDWSPKNIHNRYRHRFGIETSYRQLRRVRAVTTSLNPALRFLLLGLGLLLVNLWSFLRWTVARVIAPGPRRVDPLYFQLQRFVRFLLHAIDLAYGAIRSLQTPPLPQSVIY